MARTIEYGIALDRRRPTGTIERSEVPTQIRELSACLDFLDSSPSQFDGENLIFSLVQ